MANKITIDKKKLTDQIASQLGLKKCTIEVGWFDDVMHPINTSTKEFLNAENFDIISVGDLANILNDGFYNKRTNTEVSPRPVLDDAFYLVENRIQEIIENNINHKNPIEGIADDIINIIHEEIESGGYISNTEATLAYKNGNNPLIDEGFLDESLEYRIEK